ncbi:MAG: tetratricopeptide repeat protein [Bryobacteraceae bacterium]
MISLYRLVRTGIKVADWVVPRAREWQRLRHLNRTEGEAHFQKGNYAEAEKSLTLAAAEGEKRKTPLTKRLPVLFQLAEAHRKQGKITEARKVIGAVMVTLRQMKLDVSPEYARCLDMLAKMHETAGNMADAQRLYAEALQIEKSLKAPDAKNIASRAQRLASAHQASGDVAGAERLFRESIEFHEKAYGPDHCETGSRFAELGALLQLQGNLEAALPLLQRALAIHEKSPGGDSPEASNDLEHLAAAYHSLGRFDEACERYERALHLKERQVGVKRSQLVAMQVNLAKIYIGYSKLGPAQELLQHILMNGRTGGPEFDEAMQLMAALYDRSGRTKEAAEIRSRIASTVE